MKLSCSPGGLGHLVIVSPRGEGGYTLSVQRYSKCRVCSRSRDVVRLSRSGLCLSCARERVMASFDATAEVVEELRENGTSLEFASAMERKFHPELDDPPK